MQQYHEFIDRREGLISNEVFSAETHRRELEQVFGRTWLFVAHDSMIPRPHDYITHLMGADPVVVQRDQSGKVRVYLNKCRHRGAEVCLYESGNASSFTCSYHGWTYSDGALVGMPFAREVYRNELDRSRYGLVEARVAQLGGLIFATWSADIVSLDEYLGDAKWYLENFLLQEDMGGLEAIPGPQRYGMPVNWKLLAENFAGDMYHFENTHASIARIQSQDRRIAHSLDAGRKSDAYTVSIAANFRRGVPHGLLEVKVGPEFYEYDLKQAQGMGAEAVEWLKERHRRAEERLLKYQCKPYSFHVGNIFPNLALIGCGTAMYAKGLIMHHPASLDSTEVWMWCLVEKSAPRVVRERQQFVLMQRQSAAGMVAPDDHENFARIGGNVHTPVARRVKFHYGMAVTREDEDVRPPEQQSSEPWPGQVLPQYSEASQRDFYRYWAELMDAA
ncbi:MAG: aromatic ring-hydroxylating oxygenase subunit alpha [Burkholderiales bacterium]